MRLTISLAAALTCSAVLPSTSAPAQPAPGQAEAGVETRSPAVRRFVFHYGFRLVGLKPGAAVRVWLPVPRSGPHQRVDALRRHLPSEPSLHTEQRHGNRVLFFEAKVPPRGELRAMVPYRVERREVLTAGRGRPAPEAVERLSEQMRKLYLSANARVPIEGKPLGLIEDIQLAESPYKIARQLYEVVDSHVTYKKEGTGWGRGDVLWVCDSRYGNCTDFHSLFMSLARSQGIPARFEIGFSIPPGKKRGKIGGYHCWAFFHAGSHGWVPVDISEADKHPEMKDYYFGNLTADRVTFTVGRDLKLSPPAAAAPLNFFVYPHAEIDGSRLGKEHLKLEFSFAEEGAGAKP